jgi:hypothetical protein
LHGTDADRSLTRTFRPHKLNLSRRSEVRSAMRVERERDPRQRCTHRTIYLKLNWLLHIFRRIVSRHDTRPSLFESATGKRYRPTKSGRTQTSSCLYSSSAVAQGVELTQRCICYRSGIQLFGKDFTLRTGIGLRLFRPANPTQTTITVLHCTNATWPWASARLYPSPCS